jgi:2-isopropylmalate synthase
VSAQVYVYDCTLRDGTQGADVSLSVADKIRIAQRLDVFGVHYIEGGWPGSNPTDVEFFKRAASLEWDRSKICAFGSTRHFKHRVDQDPNLEALLAAQTPVLTVVAKGWDFHVEKVLGISLEENLTLIRESLSYLKGQGKEIVFDAEHFFDGYAGNRDYALRVLEVAQDAGADWIVICDTNGGALSSTVHRVTREVTSRFDRVGIHTHNDCELGVANTIAAVEAGAQMVQGTVNGLGERTGNANLTSVLPILELKMENRTAVGEDALRQLTSVSHFVGEIANIAVPHNLPFVGNSAFAHKGGIHVNALMKDERTYEHMGPK